MVKFALAGNPNCGKTSLFNLLTGSTAHVGNWSGVTVSKREGVYKNLEEKVSIVDLPGIYSLSPYTPEEVVSRNFLLDNSPDLIINVVDVTNLERNLYLTTQLLEIDVPIVVALNMCDVFRKEGGIIDCKKLEEALHVPVVEISALKNFGISLLMHTAYETSKSLRKGESILDLVELNKIIESITKNLEEQKIKSPLFHAIKLLEGDQLEEEMHQDTVNMVNCEKQNFCYQDFGNDFEALIADLRYSFITEKLKVVIISKSINQNSSKSDKIDKILTHKFLGIPLFLLILFFIFHITFSSDFLFLSIFIPSSFHPFAGTRFESIIGNGAINSLGVMILNFWNDVVVGGVSGAIKNSVMSSSMESWCIGLINDGIINGLATILGFLPQILLLFLFFSILEDSGYMSRVAFILDKIFRKFGLSGRAFMPMIMGFGCSVPAIINTRTLVDENEKSATIRVIPFFSCGAKVPILTAISGGIVEYFGVLNADIITYSMYLLGMIVAFLSVIIMRKTTMRGEVPPFIMELPAYHLPQLRSLFLHVFDKCKHFIQKAFTVILASTILIWFLMHFSFEWKYLNDTKINNSILANIGMFLMPLFTPLGFGSQLSSWGFVFIVATISGIIAKENTIATLGTLAGCISLSMNERSGSIIQIISTTHITIPALIAFIAFNMMTIPCCATVATAKSELSNKKRFYFTLLFWLCTSYLVASIIYTIGTWWWTSLIWLFVFCLSFIFIFQFGLKKTIAIKK